MVATNGALKWWPQVAYNLKYVWNGILGRMQPAKTCA